MDPDVPHTNKGKARAEEPDPTEETPLLASSSSSRDVERHSRTTSASSPSRRLYSRLVSVFLVSLSLCLLAFVILVLVAYLYRSRAAHLSPDEIIQRALVVRGPDGVNVLNATEEDGIWLAVRGRIGVDAGTVAGVTSHEDDGVFADIWKSLGRWGIRRLDRVTVDLSNIEVRSVHRPFDLLGTIYLPPLEVPLTADPPRRDLNWLTEVEFPVRVQPTTDGDALVEFVRDSWKEGFASVRALVSHASVRGGGVADKGWRGMFSVSHSNVRSGISIKIPTVPGLPKPGENNPLPEFSDFVALQAFRITSEDDTIKLVAHAVVTSPLPPDTHFAAPSLPFIVSLPSFATEPTIPAAIPVASVTTHAFSLSSPNSSVYMNGSVLPLSQSAAPALSAFASQYISGHDADIVISTPLIPTLALPAKFPAPRPKPEILRNVSISDMKIRAVGTSFVASGVVRAHVVLPKGIDVGVNASRVFPDVIVFDGAVPADEYWPTHGHKGKAGNPPTRPLPDPLPPHAFAHILPEDWLPAECLPAESGEGDGSTVAVTAHIVDVPLEVLPGREREFSNFVSKVIFGSEGALAGVQGVAAVAVRVNGLPFANGHDGEMELSGLPFQGSVRIGRKG